MKGLYLMAFAIMSVIFIGAATSASAVLPSNCAQSKSVGSGILPGDSAQSQQAQQSQQPKPFGSGILPSDSAQAQTPP